MYTTRLLPSSKTPFQHALELVLSSLRQLCYICGMHCFQERRRKPRTFKRSENSKKKFQNRVRIFKQRKLSIVSLVIQYVFGTFCLPVMVRSFLLHSTRFKGSTISQLCCKMFNN